MTYFEDLAPCTLFTASGGVLRAVGWLSPDHPFVSGEVDSAFFEKLIRLLNNPWQPALMAGRHLCKFCRFTGGPAQVEVNGVSAGVGVHNLFVPGENCVFVAPSLIAHYIDSHGYCPPMEFVRAVMQCPEMRSMQYLKAMAHFQVSHNS